MGSLSTSLAFGRQSYLCIKLSVEFGEEHSLLSRFIKHLQKDSQFIGILFDRYSQHVPFVQRPERSAALGSSLNQFEKDGRMLAENRAMDFESGLLSYQDDVSIFVPHVCRAAVLNLGGFLYIVTATTCIIMCLSCWKGQIWADIRVV